MDPTQDQRGLRMMFAAHVVAHCEYPCVATQDAIDRLSAEWGHGRDHMLALIRDRLTSTEVVELLLVAWKDRDVLLATGRSRAQWIDIFDGKSRREMQRNT